MALNVEVNGVNKNAFVRRKTTRIQKDGAIETCRVEFLDHDTTAAAFRVAPGDELRVDRDGVSLEFGGEATRVTDQRLSGLDDPSGMTPGQRGGGTVTIVEARNWYFEAADVRLPIFVWPGGGLFDLAEYLRSTYLDAKGWTMLGPLTGGPALPVLVYVNKTIAEIFDDQTKTTFYPWRVNGDREMAFVEPGSLTAPHTYDNTNSIVLRGATWTQDRARRATRLFVTTGGTGQFVDFHSDHIADGTVNFFPVHVLPQEIAAAVNNVGGYAAGASSLALDGLPKSFTFKAGATIRFADHGPYELTSDATSNADGEATFALTGPIAQAVVDDQSVTLDAGATVRLEVNGTPTALGSGSDWSFDQEQAQFRKDGSVPASGTVVRYKALISYPAVVRVWAEEAQGTFGNFNYLTVKDAELSWPQYTDVVPAKLAAVAELTYRIAEPKELKLATFAQDVYPWMIATCSFPERGISGPFMVTSISLTDVGRKDGLMRAELTLVEGFGVGRDWRDFWKGTDGGARLVPSAKLAQSGYEVMLFQKNAQIAQSGFETMVQLTATAQLAQSGIEVMVA
jgi:hypothetical protein